MGSHPVIFRNVEKHYGGLRPLRIRELAIPHGRTTMLIGFDRPSAEIFVNLATGATLPDKGEVISLDRPTAAIATSDEWLAFVERFGIVSERVVLLEAMTIAQNLAMSFDLRIDPVPAAVMTRVTALARDAGIEPAALERRVAELSPLLRAQIHLARALALDPQIVLLEHPTANLAPEEATDYAAIVKQAAGRRQLTVIGLLMDEKFAKAAGGRLLFWQPATGELKERSILRRYFSTFTVIV